PRFRRRVAHGIPEYHVHRPSGAGPHRCLLSISIPCAARGRMGHSSLARRGPRYRFHAPFLLSAPCSHVEISRRGVRLSAREPRGWTVVQYLRIRRVHDFAALAAVSWVYPWTRDPRIGETRVHANTIQLPLWCERARWNRPP